METNTPEYRSGFVTLVGKPNVGKSTLLNGFLGQKVAAVSPRPQTTRRRQLGILTLEHAQIVFVDTPGMHKPVHKLGVLMNQEASETLPDADVIILMVDASQPPDEEDRLLIDKIQSIQTPPPILLALNKIDLVSPADKGTRTKGYLDLLPQAAPIEVSAETGYQRDLLLQEIIARLPEGPRYYDEAQITDLYERDIAADLIRESALVNLRDEVPHSIAVRIDEYKERSDGVAYIAATLFVERDSQKGIVVGQKGSMIKKIGTTARQEIEKMSERKVFLELNVKVSKNWRDDIQALRRLGLDRKDD